MAWHGAGKPAEQSLASQHSAVVKAQLICLCCGSLCPISLCFCYSNGSSKMTLLLAYLYHQYIFLIDTFETV